MDLQRVIVLGHVLQISPVPCGGYTRSLSFQVPKQNKLKQFIPIPYWDDDGITVPSSLFFYLLSLLFYVIRKKLGINWYFDAHKNGFLEEFPSIDYGHDANDLLAYFCGLTLSIIWSAMIQKELIKEI